MTTTNGLDPQPASRVGSIQAARHNLAGIEIAPSHLRWVFQKRMTTQPIQATGVKYASNL